MEKTIYYELKRGEMAKLIREMQPNDTLIFPLAKLESVRNIAYNRLLVEKSEGAKWRVSVDLQSKQTLITRIS